MDNTIGGAKKSVKGRYIDFLNKTYTVYQLRSYCVSRKIKINKRYNNKIVLLTKKSLIKKIADLKYPAK